MCYQFLHYHVWLIIFFISLENTRYLLAILLGFEINVMCTLFILIAPLTFKQKVAYYFLILISLSFFEHIAENTW